MPDLPILGHLISGLDRLLAEPRVAAVVGPLDDPRTLALADVIRTSFAPQTCVAVYDPQSKGPRPALFEKRDPLDGQPAVYVCQGTTCAAPVTSPAALQEMLK